MELRHGVFLAPFHALDENPTLCFERDLALIELLDDLGFDEAWIGEHHSGAWRRSIPPRSSSPRPPSGPSTSASAPASSPCRTTIPSTWRTDCSNSTT